MNNADITFITGNQNKADYLAKYLGIPVKHVKLDLDEIQSLDLRKIVEHKVREAYEKIKGPVIVEDVSLELEALKGLPGPFVRFFVDKGLIPDMCRMLDGKSRKAIGRCTFGYYDGNQLELFEGKINGEIAMEPMGDNGFGWDRIFIPEGYTVTIAELNKEDHRKVYLQIRPFAALKDFLSKES